MVSGSRIEGGTQIFPARVRKSIQSIKEVVGNHSDADIYTALKESNMDLNETTQKLLSQDPFREVKRRRDKKKENVGYKGSMDIQRYPEDVRQGTNIHSLSDRNFRRGAYTKSPLPGISREFRIVRDNRVNRNTNREVKPASQNLSTSTEVSSNVLTSGLSPTGAQRPSGGRISQVPSRRTDSHPSNQQDGYSTGMGGKELMEDKRATMSNSVPDMDVVKLSNTEQRSAVLASDSASVGLYSSSTDPVHVPSPDSRSSVAVGAIKREVGAVGVRRQLKEDSMDQSSGPGVTLTDSVVGKEGSSTDSFRPLRSISKGEHLSQIAESMIPGLGSSRSTLNSQHGNKQHQQNIGHQKASQPNKEWKPKSSHKSSISNPGVIGTPTKSTPPGDKSEELASDRANLQDKLTRLNIHENQNVIIAEHIRVPETERYRLIFGSFGADLDSSGCLPSGFQPIRSPEELNGESSASELASAPEISTDDASGSRQVDLVDNQVRNLEPDSPASGAAPELQLTDKIETSSPQTLGSYPEIGLAQDRSQYAPDSLHQHHAELPGFSAYDSQSGYDIPYFRPTVDETVRVQGLPSQDAVNSHSANIIPASTMSMVQQQQQAPVAQMYPQVHVSHFTNLMPYRQFLSPVYVPPMAMPGYSNSPAYPHPANGSSYLLMPGGGSHMNANNLKYGIQQFKPVPAGSPAGFGNFNNPSAYAINGPGVVGSATGLEDSSRIKYKDGNLYVPNAQAETSEIWIQNPRDLPGLQSTPYYNMPGQTPHGAYLPSHTGHASFSGAVPQSSQMQFPGLYHPSPQPAAIGNPHHLGPGIGGNVGVGVATPTPGPQVGAFQQPQLGHLNWTTNF